jgi:hexokinase
VIFGRGDSLENYDIDTEELMSALQKALGKIVEQMTISNEQIALIAENFRNEMLEGLAGNKSSLKMLPSFLVTPTGKETGTFLALDFGGTNIRGLLVDLLKDGKFIVREQRTKQLKDSKGQYDYLYSKVSGEALFDFIADHIASVAEQEKAYDLGHTFSFPCEQTEINKAKLIHWDKEINVTGVEGFDINTLLSEALVRRGLPNIKPRAIINDTVGTLLTAAYSDAHADIGSICGTGHNTAYLETNILGQTPMIINIESGYFNNIDTTIYDDELDKASEQPGEQRLEKMISGCYLGTLLRIIARNLLQEGLFVNCSNAADKILSKRDSISSQDISVLISDHSADLSKVAYWLERNLRITISSMEDRIVIKRVAELIASRSARLVAATYIGIISHIDPLLERKHTITIDGSLYEKMPGYDKDICQALGGVLHEKAHMVNARLSKDGSGIGAAIAAAIADRQ